MKIDKQACFHLFTTATTAMAAVSPQQYRDDVATQPNPKTINNYLFNDNAASSGVVGHPTTATSTSTATTSTANPILDTSVRKSDQVLSNKKDNASLDTSTKQRDTTDADADVGILEFGAEFPSYKTISYHRTNEVEQVGSSEVQQSHRRLEYFVCPSANCPASPFSLNSDDTLSCNAPDICEDFVVENFVSGSTITCAVFRSCRYIDATGAGTMFCFNSISCQDAKITLQNEGTLLCSDTESCTGASITLQDEGSITCSGFSSCAEATITIPNEGRLECSNQFACLASITYTGSSFVYCRAYQSCGINSEIDIQSNTFIAESDGGTLLCKALFSCYANFYLGDYIFLIICEDSYSCASGSYVVGTENTCVVCVQQNSCTQLDNIFFEEGADKTQPQVTGPCSDMQLDTACTLIDSTVASSLTFCQTSPPSASLLPSITPSASSHPSLVPSTTPSESSHPSLLPSVTPSASSQPSLEPSNTPSESSQPSLGPSESSQPSLATSIKPSSSSQPSLFPSITPSSSSHPSLVPSMPPSSSSQPSLVPSVPPSESSQPSDLPTAKPFVGKPTIGKPTIGKKAGNGKKAGSKKGSYGGKKKHPETWSAKKESTKVKDIVMREP